MPHSFVRPKDEDREKNEAEHRKNRQQDGENRGEHRHAVLDHRNDRVAKPTGGERDRRARNGFDGVNGAREGESPQPGLRRVDDRGRYERETVRERLMMADQS